MRKLKNVEGYMVDLNELKSVKGHWTPEGQVYQGKNIRAGIFVDCTGKSEKEKDAFFKKARKEIGKEAESLNDYEVLKV